MNRTYLSALTVALATLAAGHALAADATASLTREQVKAELAQAIRNGDIVVGESGETAYALNPSRYPARPVAQGKTREQVKAELAQAIRNGDIVVGESGETAYALNPSRYPSHPVAQGKTRAQVKAELAEAIRKGEMPLNLGS